MKEIKEKRVRKNQPSGYYGNNHSKDLIIEYYCEEHDYFYYPEAWTNEKTKWHYEKGYYDENGKLYSTLALSEDGIYKGDLRCSKCKALNKGVLWSEEAIPSCKECGDTLEDELSRIAIDKIIKKVETYNPKKQKKKHALKGIIAAVIILAIAITTLILLNKYGKIDIPLPKKEITEETRYFDKLGKECKYIDTFGCYYDPENDCFIKGYQIGDKEEWTYWYYDISSKYNEFGWIRYDEEADKWFVEVSKDNLQQLSVEETEAFMGIKTSKAE